jgi:NADH-quinone oxidoreductase subunit H
MTVLHSIAAFLQTGWVELLCGLVIVIVVPPIAGYFALAERKLAADMRADPGPAADSSESLPQRIAVIVKGLLKDETLPRNADKALLHLAPIVSFATAMTALAAIAIGPSSQVVRDSNIGLLFVMGASFLGLFGTFLGGWALRGSNSRLAAVQATARLITYQIAALLALITAILLAGTLRIQSIVDAQQHDAAWSVFLAPTSFILFAIASLLGADRDPFVPSEFEAEFGDSGAEHGFRWTLFLIAGYTNRIVIASIATTVFLGGWLRPFSSVYWFNWLDAVPPMLLAFAGVYAIRQTGKQSVRAQKQLFWSEAVASFVLATLLTAPLIFASLRFLRPGLYGAFWFLSKVVLYIYFSTALRFAVSHLHFDQSMQIGWRFLIPLAAVNLFFVAICLLLESEYRWNRWLATILTTLLTVTAASILYYWRRNRVEDGDSRATPAIATDSHAG